MIVGCRDFLPNEKKIKKRKRTTTNTDWISMFLFKFLSSPTSKMASENVRFFS